MIRFKTLIDCDIIVYKACSVKNEYDAIQDGKIVETFTSAKEYKAWFTTLPLKIQEVTTRETIPQEKTLDTAQLICDTLIHNISVSLNAASVHCYLTADNKSNFRFDLATLKEYKGNRKDLAKPKWYEEIRKYLVYKYGAIIIHGREADDALAEVQQASTDNLNQLESTLTDADVTCIASIDKDLLQVQGYHYNFDRKVLKYVSKVEGLKAFYLQLLTGDSTDNIPGLFNLTNRRCSAKFKAALLSLTTEIDMYDLVYNIYKSANTAAGRREDGDVYTLYLKEVGNLLYMRRTATDTWCKPHESE